MDQNYMSAKTDIDTLADYYPNFTMSYNAIVKSLLISSEYL